MKEEIKYPFNCQFAGCKFKGEYTEKEIIKHFQDNHTLIRNVPVGNKNLLIPIESEESVKVQPYMTLKKFVEKVRQELGRTAMDRELDIAVTYTIEGEIIVLPPDTLANSMEQQNRIRIKLL